MRRKRGRAGLFGPFLYLIEFRVQVADLAVDQHPPFLQRRFPPFEVRDLLRLQLCPGISKAAQRPAGVAARLVILALVISFAVFPVRLSSGVILPSCPGYSGRPQVKPPCQETPSGRRNSDEPQIGFVRVRPDRN